MGVERFNKDEIIPNPIDSDAPAEHTPQPKEPKLNTRDFDEAQKTREATDEKKLMEIRERLNEDASYPEDFLALNGEHREGNGMSFTTINETGGYHLEKGKPSEDQSFGYEENGLTVAGVADGVGGGFAGREAGELAVEAFREYVRAHDEQTFDKNPTAYMEAAFVEMDKNVLRKEDNRITITGQTTFTVGVFRGDTLYIGHIGDSRAYKLSPNGELTPLTLDDSYLKDKATYDEEEINKKAPGSVTPGEKAREYQNIFSETTDPADLPADLAPYWKQRNNITRALGMQHNREDEDLPEDMSGNVNVPTIFTTSVKSGDRFLFTSDGLHDMLTDGHIAEVWSAFPNDAEACVALSQAVHEVFEKKDARIKTLHDDMGMSMVTYAGEEEKYEPASNARDAEHALREKDTSEEPPALQQFSTEEAERIEAGNELLKKWGEIRREFERDTSEALANSGKATIYVKYLQSFPTSYRNISPEDARYVLSTHDIFWNGLHDSERDAFESNLAEEGMSAGDLKEALTKIEARSSIPQNETSPLEEKQPPKKSFFKRFFGR